MKVSTTAYQFAHGKTPKGQGIWAFDFHTHDGQRITEFCLGVQKYSDARKWAVKYAQLVGAVKISVAS